MCILLARELRVRVLPLPQNRVVERKFFDRKSAVGIKKSFRSVKVLSLQSKGCGTDTSDDLS